MLAGSPSPVFVPFYWVNGHFYAGTSLSSAKLEKIEFGKKMQTPIPKSPWVPRVSISKVSKAQHVEKQPQCPVIFVMPTKKHPFGKLLQYLRDIFF
jgi:hypothetical protein